MVFASPMIVAFKDNEDTTLYKAHASVGGLIKHSLHGDAIEQALGQFEKDSVQGKIMQSAAAWTKLEVTSQFVSESSIYIREETDNMFSPKKPFAPSKPAKPFKPK
jgi:hypothetical protein